MDSWPSQSAITERSIFRVEASPSPSSAAARAERRASARARGSVSGRSWCALRGGIRPRPCSSRLRVRWGRGRDFCPLIRGAQELRKPPDDAEPICPLRRLNLDGALRPPQRKVRGDVRGTLLLEE